MNHDEGYGGLASMTASPKETQMSDDQDRCDWPVGDCKCAALFTARIEELQAENARLRDALRPLATEARCRCMYESRDTERAYENGECDHQRARAALAEKD